MIPMRKLRLWMGGCMTMAAIVLMIVATSHIKAEETEYVEDSADLRSQLSQDDSL
jgi:hypothetical protein